jgi:hypothetical protein
MKVTLLLADAAQAAGGKLYILGGGWSITGPGPSTCALALKVEVPWDQANQRHRFELSLVDEDGRQVILPSDQGERPIDINGEFEVGRPPGLLPGTPIDYVLAVNFASVPFPPGRRLEWRLSIDGRTEDDWRVGFTTRPSSPQQPGRPEPPHR